MAAWIARMKKEGWLLLLLALVVTLCLFTGGGGAKTAADQTQDEERLSAILSAMDGVGRARAAIFCDETGRPAGVVVVADGADDLSVQLRVARAVMTLVRIDADQVVVCRSKEGPT